MSDRNGMNETTNTQCDNVIAPHSGHRMMKFLLLLKNVDEERQRKPKIEEMTLGEMGAERLLAPWRFLMF